MRWRRSASLGVAGLVLLAVSCSPGQTGGPLPPSTPTVEVDILDDNLTHDEPVPAGRVVFRVTNAGEAGHRLTLVPLPEDYPPILRQLRGDERRSAELLARVPHLQSGESGSFAVDLVEGQRYALVDFSEAADGTMHGRLGVAGEFRAGGPDADPPPTPAPAASPAPAEGR